MKKIITLILLIIFLLLIKVPKYVELNNLAIIEGISVEYNYGSYFVTLKEIIPTKDDNGIKYSYKYYSYKESSLDNIYKKISNSNKKIYLKKTKYLVTNITKSKKIIKKFNLVDVKIYHNKDSLKKLKSINS